MSAPTFTEHEVQPDAPAPKKFVAADASTPRPWRAVHNRGVSWEVLGANGELVAEMPYDDATTERSAEEDAALMCRAVNNHEQLRAAIDASIHVDADVAQALKLWADQISFQYAGRPGAKVADDMRALVARMEACLRERREALDRSAHGC